MPLRLVPGEAGGKFLVDAVEAAIGKNSHHVSAAQLRNKLRSQSIRHRGRAMPACPGRSARGPRPPDAAARPPQCVAAGRRRPAPRDQPGAGWPPARPRAPCAAECWNAAPAPPTAAHLGIHRAQRSQRLANRRGMMRKIVDDGYAANFGAHLQPPLHAPEALERGNNRVFGDALVGGQGGGGGGVQGVVLARKLHLQIGPLRAVAPHLPSGAAGLVGQVSQSAIVRAPKIRIAPLGKTRAPRTRSRCRCRQRPQ